MTSSDILVIGAGVNGLAAATRLALAGRQVMLLEAAEEPGGAARTEPLCDGFRVPRIAHLLNRLHPQVIATLELARHGLDLSAPVLPTVLLSDQGPVTLHGGYGTQLEGVGAAEGQAWQALRARLIAQAGVLKPFLARVPPEFGTLSLSDKAAFARAGYGLWRQGEAEAREFLRMVLMCAADVAEESLSDDRLRGLIAFDATLGSALGPRSPTSLLGLYYRLSGEWGGVAGAQSLPAGGIGAVTGALARAAAAAGVTLRCGVRVGRIETEADRVTGVTLTGGEVLKARAVLSALAPQTTLLTLLGADRLDTGVARSLAAIRARGVSAKLNLALDGVPEFAGVGAGPARLVLAPSVDHVERAWNGAKYGEAPEAPVMEITLPGAGDGSLAPPGASVLSAIVQFVPHALKSRDGLMERCIASLDRRAPGLSRMVRHAELLTPADIEARYGLPGGHWHMGEITPDALFMLRPGFGLARYRAPVAGLWLCGAGTHPGGGVCGISGLNAAGAMLEDGA